MKYTLFTLLTISLFASSASASLLIYEGFDYTIGERLVGQTNPGTGIIWGQPNAPSQPEPELDDQRIVSGNLAYPGLPDPSGQSFVIPRTIQSNIARINLPGAPYTFESDPPSLFFSFTMQLATWHPIGDGFDLGQAGHSGMQAGNFIAGFVASTGTGGMSAANVYAGQLRIRREVDENGIQSGRYQLGFHKNNLGGNVADWDTTQSYEVGENVLLVGEYQFMTDDPTDDIVRLWVNPIPGDPAGTPNVVSTSGFDVSTTGGASQGVIRDFWFRSGTVSPGDILVDEVRIGTTFESVTPSGPPVGFSADFNGDGEVDGSDFLIWQRGFGVSDGTANPIDGDATGDGNVNGDDLAVWKSQFGTFSGSAVAAVPEPGSIALTFLGLLGLSLWRLH